MKKIAFKRKDKRCFGNRSGFTLVEAITTLVILAIVAAVAIPSLVGYIDSSREKIAVDECSTVVEAANALGVEHVLEVGVVNYDTVVPLADSSEAGESVYSSVTKEAILKRAELEDKGEIKNFSFDPKDSDGYSQPAYLVNEEEVVVSAAADITLAKNIVSPLAVSVEKTTDTDFNETTGISLTYLEYTASNGIDVVYHNGGYQASSKVNVDFKNHNLTATVKQVLTCEQDEIVLFECSGCDICDGTNNYSVTAVTAFAPGHNYGALTCVDKDQHEQTCTNVLNRLAEGDKALSVGDTLDLEPQYDIYNLPRVGEECEPKIIDGEHFGDITKDVEFTKDLERDIPFSLDGVYKSSGDVPAGKYTVKTCSGCGYSEYVTRMPDGLVIIDNNNDNVADKATISKESIESGDPLVFETVSEAVKYLGSASVGNSQVIKLLGNVTETEAVNVAGETLTHITITSRSGNRYTWKGVDLHFASKTQADSSITLENIVIDNGNAAQIPVQASYGVTILGNGATIKNVKDCAVELTGGTFEMHDGAVITKCSSSKNSGGAISASTNGGIINLYGGTIENCSSAENGGAICVNSKTTLNIKGNPVVVNNTASEKGNNIYLESGKTLNVVGDISGTKTIGIESADDVRNQVSGEFGANENTGYLNGKMITAFKNDVNTPLHAEVKDGKIIWAEEKTSGNGTGNWRDPRSDKEVWEDQGVEFYVTGSDPSLGTSSDVSCWDYNRGDNLGPYRSFVVVKNEGNRYVKRFKFTYRLEYIGTYKTEPVILNWSANWEELYNVTIDQEAKTVTVESSDEYLRRVLDYTQRDTNTLCPPKKDSEGKLIPTEYCIDISFGTDLLDEGTNFYLENCEVEFVDTWATKFELNYQGDFSYFDYIKLTGMDFCNEAGEPISTNEDFPKNNPISFYARVGDGGTPKVQFYTSGEQNPLFEYQIPRDEVVKNADNEGIVNKNIPVDDIEISALKLIYNGVDKEDNYQIRCYNNSTPSQIYSKDITSQKDYICKVYENLLAHNSDIRIELVSRSSWKIISSTIIPYDTLMSYRGKILEVTFPTKDFAVKVKFDYPSLQKYAKKLRATGAGVSKTVDVKEDFLISGILPGNNNEDIKIDILSDNDMIIGTHTLSHDTYNNYNNGRVCEVTASPTAVVLKLKTSITDSSVSAKTAEINIKGANVLLDSKSIDISGGSADILAVPTADRDITVSFKSGGKTIAKKSIEIPYLGEMYNIEITNDDVYTEPNIPEPKPNAVNIRIKFDSKFKDDVEYIRVEGPVYNNFPIGELGLVITNIIYEREDWYPDLTVILYSKDNIELGKATVKADDWKNLIGDTVEIEIKPLTNLIKLNIIYRGEDYSRVHCLKVDGAQSPPNWQGVSVSANSNNIGSIYVTINNNSDITISAYEGDIWGTSIAQRTIPWSEIQKHLGDEVDVVIDPV